MTCCMATSCRVVSCVDWTGISTPVMSSISSVIAAMEDSTVTMVGVVVGAVVSLFVWVGWLGLHGSWVAEETDESSIV